MSSLDKLTEYAATLEALVFASDKPVTRPRITTSFA